MTPMYLPGTAAVIDDAVAAEAEVVRVTAISATIQVALVASPVGPAGIVRSPCVPGSGGA